VGREERVSAAHGIVGRVRMWERGVGKGRGSGKGKNVRRVTCGQWNVVLNKKASLKL